MSAYENRIMDPKIDLGHEFREKYGEPSFPKFVDMILEVRLRIFYLLSFICFSNFSLSLRTGLKGRAQERAQMRAQESLFESSRES